jgi:hypothetical protein
MASIMEKLVKEKNMEKEILNIRLVKIKEMFMMDNLFLTKSKKIFLNFKF